MLSKPESKPRKPENTAFKQQRLKSWQPILTPKSVLPSLFVISLIFTPLGSILLYFSNNVSEISIDYTDCYKHQENTAIEDNLYYMTFPTSFSTKRPSYKSKVTEFENHPNKYKSPLCTVKFAVPTALEPPLYFYYELSNFYQNHRRYTKSVSWQQLFGYTDITDDNLDSCKPLKGEMVNDKFIPYYPCGLIANSFFNDTFSALFIPDSEDKGYEFSSEDISLEKDRTYYKNNPYKLDEILPPPNWKINYPDGKYSEKYPPPDLSKDYHFQVWMRIAGQPRFRKFYGKNLDKKMIPGIYEIRINMNYNITEYGGRKKFIITTSSPLGKNSLLGFVYIFFSICCVVLGMFFTARHFYKPRKLGDHTYLSWNQNSNQQDHL